MPLHHAVLALLVEGPSHGYELKARFEEAIGPQWGGLNIGHVYQVLDRLTRDGFVTKSVVAQSDRPDKTRYTLTAEGQGELEAWAAEAWVRTSGFRDELFLKLFGAARLGRPALEAFVTAQRSTYMSELAELTRRRREHAADPMVALLIDAAIAHTKADLALIEDAPERLRDATAPQPAASTAGASTAAAQSASDVAPRRSGSASAS